MPDTKYGYEKVSEEILIIGGGIGGLTAAISIKEIDPNVSVLVVEKQTAGYAGKANKGGGVLQYFDEETLPPEAFVEYYAREVGGYLLDQELMLKYVKSNKKMIEKLKEWGVKVPVKEDGSYLVFPMGPTAKMIGVDLDLTMRMRRHAEKLGVKFIDKVTVADLMVTDGKISGAVGYSILDGKFYEFDAETVILATGSQNYRYASMFSNGRGDGMAAAFRAGAMLRNPEFGTMAQFLRAKTHEEVVFGENVMYNRLNENITQNFRRFMESDISSSAIAEWYNQMAAMKGPVYLHVEEFEPCRSDLVMTTLWDRPYGMPFWMAHHNKAHAIETDYPHYEVCIGFIGEQSPIKVDHSMATTLPGLFAIGDVCYSGSTMPGAVPAPPARNRGSGILFAVFSGIECAEGAVKSAKSAQGKLPSAEQINASIDYIYAPLNRKEGHTAKEVINRVQEAMVPVEQSIYMSEHRMLIALRMVEEAKEMAKTLKADDFHGMLSCHEAEAMVLSAELHYRAALLRKESRGWFLREDYPEMDNKNWLKWTTVKNENGELKFGTEDVPYKKWPIQPPVV